MRDSPTQRTLKLLREEGWTAAVVEKWNPYARIRQDLWGVDVLAIESGGVFVKRNLLAVQACAGSSHAARRAKLCGNPDVRKLMEAGVTVEVWSWSQKMHRNADGSKAKVKRWQCRRDRLAFADLTDSKEVAA